jgi:hypothetical protein
MATAGAASADPMTLCAKKGANGYILYGHNATTTDWAANKAIGEAIGDGKCQSGWTLQSNMKSAKGSRQVTTGTAKGIEVTSSETSTVSAGRKTGAFNGNFPSVIRNVDTGARKKFIGTDSAGRGLYKLTNNGFYPKGTVQTWSKARLAARDVNSGYTGPNAHKLRYDASKDVTKETTKTTTYRTKTIRIQVCPHSYDFLWRNMFGQLVAKVEQDIVPCRWKTVSSSVVETMTQIGRRTYVSSKYIK